VGYTIFRQDEVEWIERDDGSGRTVTSLSDALTKSRANMWRYPP